MRPTGGQITDTARPGVRRALEMELADQDGSLYELLAPSGTLLTVICRVGYTSRETFDIPMGVFDVDSNHLTEGKGSLSITAPDKWARVQRARFLKPQSSIRNATAVSQIVTLIQGALGAGENVQVTATSSATVGALTWERDRDEAIINLAKYIGAWVYFDRQGGAVVADAPVIGVSADWLVDASASGVLITLDREQNRDTARNVVAVDSSAADGAKFVTQYVWDADPGSPTWAGPDPVNRPDLAGPFGVVPEFFSSPLITTATQAALAARTILARTVGLASQVSLSEVPNPALDAGQVIDVLPPGRSVASVLGTDGFGEGPFGTSPFGLGDTTDVLYASNRKVERHIADTVTHPLVGGTQRIDGRSTRIDDATGGL